MTSVRQAAPVVGTSSDCPYEAIARGETPWPILRIGQGAGRTKRNPIIEHGDRRGWHLLLSDWLKERRWAIQTQQRRRREEATP